MVVESRGFAFRVWGLTSTLGGSVTKNHDSLSTWALAFCLKQVET